MAALTHNEDELQIFQRQVLQLVDPNELKWPSKHALRRQDTQARIYQRLFQSEHPPPDRYQLRVLKKLLNLIEESIVDPDQDEISDDLSNSLANLMTKKLPSEAQAVQQPSYVTYNFSSGSNQVPCVTLLESRLLISNSGGTGFRTWEAGLHLGSYLASDDGAALIRGRRVLELGSGTGLLSILCARWLDCAHVTATDGDDRVVEALENNFFLNGLQQSDCIDARLLKWGRALEEDEGGKQRDVDVVIGADVTYDPSIIPPLVSTLRELSTLNENVEILIAAAIRKADTFSVFLHACERSNFTVMDVNYPMIPKNEQSGPFYLDNAPVRIFRLRSLGQRDPFAI